MVSFYRDTTAAVRRRRRFSPLSVSERTFVRSRPHRRDLCGSVDSLFSFHSERTTHTHTVNITITGGAAVASREVETVGAN